jgi:triosephosphate isomerase
MQARRPLIAGNWKMYKTIPEAVATARELAALAAAAPAPRAEVMIAPAFPALASVSQVLERQPVALGAQDLFWESEGAFTGAVSAPMLLSAGCRYVIIGHSERRQLFGETDEAVNRKLAAALAAGLIPVMCVGETEAQREANQTFAVLDKQLSIGLKGFFTDQLATLVVAYEPVWAIGTGKTATSAQAQEVHAFIRERLQGLFDKNLSGVVRILYGGSVKPGNIAELMAMPDVDGALVGGASLDAASFIRIVRYDQATG